MKTLARYLNATTFFVAASLGILVALSLFFYEVNRSDDIEFATPISERSDGASIVQVRARNTTDETICPEIRIAARDGEGKDLDVAVAEPVNDDGEFQPRESILYRAVLDDITEQEFTEEFDDYATFVWEMQDCNI